ncbi:GAF domain-containing protein [Bradyrhizobium sp. PMVTL-01]|uniref:GAF domain-containing protein n=1 Tax=Bradyrhizobium sp. PMVTL-01 TaxID=3434999 RepID=UPI003F6E679C
MARSARAGGKRVSAAKKRNQNVRNPPKTKRPIRGTTPEIPPEDTELREAREQQAATAEILKVIANSPSDQRVFDAIASNAKLLIGGYSAAVHRVIDDVIHMVAFTPVSHEADEALRAAFPLPLSQWPLIASMQGGEAVQIADAETADPQNQRLGRARGWRSVLLMPLMSQGKFIGFIACTRREPGAFSPHHIQLLQTFADQAVIAVENARLFNETKEALERQTATSDILKVIASSPSDVQPVFEAIVNSAARLFEPCSATITLRQKDELHWGATAASITGFDVDHARSIYPIPFDPDRAPSAKAILERRMIEIPDTAAPGTPEIARSAAVAAGFRSITYVPLISQDRGIGTIILTHPQPGRWLSEKQLSLVQTFADQAVIAIENVRLFEQVQARTRDLAESLQQQTATADVLKVISRSAFDLQTVLDKLVESATHLCEADHAWLFQRDGELLRFSSSYGHGTAQHERIKEFFRSREVRIERGSIVGRSASEGRVVHVADVLSDPEYTWNEAQKIGGYRAALGAPLLRDGSVVGVIFVAKTKPEPYSRKQIELVTTFADQAVIAIENARLFNEVQAKTRDLEESLQQQTATSEVLQIINSSPSELAPVFDAMLARAMRLCEAAFGGLWLFKDEGYRAVALRGVPPAYARYLETTTATPGPHTAPYRFLHGERSAIQNEDLAAEEPYLAGDPQRRALVDLGRARSALQVPLVNNDRVLGVITIYRQQVKSFSEKQVALLENFAAQAVVAIENARLFSETKEALERQTATAEVLEVISSSPGDLKPVFDRMLAKAMHLCEAQCGFIYRIEQGAMRAVAEIGVPPAFAEYRRTNLHTGGAATPVDVMRATRKPAHVHDARESEPYRKGNPNAVAGVDLGGARTVLYVPMIKNDDIVGVINVYRQEVRPFTEAQIALLENFASQAVIAIENARLFNETQEALERQTATADVLKVIASSPSNLQPVFDAIAERSNRLVGGLSTTVLSIDGDTIHLSAFTRTNAAADEALAKSFPRKLSEQAFGESVSRGEIYQLPDTEAEPTLRELAHQRGYRSMLFIPLLRDGVSIGMIGQTRVEPGPFADRHVEMLKTFADQAVIAIENARLFNEVQARTVELTDALEQQTATAEILGVISSSAGDLAPVFDAMLSKAMQLCGANFGVLNTFDGQAFHTAATYGLPSAYDEYRRKQPLEYGPGTAPFRLLNGEPFVHLADLLQSEPYRKGEPNRRALVDIGGAQCLLAVPLLRDDRVVGNVMIFRQENRPFSEKQITLLQQFAAQAVIAIENTRLVRELRERTDALSRSLDDLRAAQDRLVQTEKLASLGQLTAGIAHEIKNPLNFVNNFSALSIELTDELNDALTHATLAEQLRKEVDELTGLLKSNLEKVVQHGKRADSIVKNMLLHSREGSGELRAVDINGLVDESLNLAYHGARAEKPGFNITLQRQFDAAAGEAELFPQEITRALLNLISNGFYAATKRTAENGAEAIEPTLLASTKNLGTSVQIRIRDNGTGIPADVKEKIFNPFFTTKPAGEGTGLGLSMAHDIIVKQHGGTIRVDTNPGEYTEFIVTLPRATGAQSNQRSMT